MPSCEPDPHLLVSAAAAAAAAVTAGLGRRHSKTRAKGEEEGTSLERRALFGSGRRPVGDCLEALPSLEGATAARLGGGGLDAEKQGGGGSSSSKSEDSLPLLLPKARPLLLFLLPVTRRRRRRLLLLFLLRFFRCSAFSATQQS